LADNLAEQNNGVIMIREVDLHGTNNFFDARMVIQDELLNAYNSDISELKFIHGHRGGTVYRDYIRHGKMLRDAPAMMRDNLVIKKHGSGATIVQFTN
tara:strand:+ start:206 stop:499 length:294 start_codon:yes stop_codon:yes gene_type:complete